MPNKPRDRLFVTLSPSKRAALERLRAALGIEKDTPLIGAIISQADKNLGVKKLEPQDGPGQMATAQEEEEKEG